MKSPPTAHRTQCTENMMCSAPHKDTYVTCLPVHERKGQRGNDGDRDEERAVVTSTHPATYSPHPITLPFFISLYNLIARSRSSSIMAFCAIDSTPSLRDFVPPFAFVLP